MVDYIDFLVNTSVHFAFPLRKVVHTLVVSARQGCAVFLILGDIKPLVIGVICSSNLEFLVILDVSIVIPLSVDIWAVLLELRPGTFIHYVIMVQHMEEVVIIVKIDVKLSRDAFP